MPGIKELKTRIKSIQSTRKITRAMQMVSAAKMRKAQNAVMASRTYGALAWELIVDLAGKIRVENSLLQSHPNAKKTGVLLLATNGGLVGGLNSNLGARLKMLGADAEVLSEVVVYGKQASTLARRLDKTVVADFPKKDKNITTEDIYPLASYLTEAYMSGQYRSIVILYNHFVSTLIQRPTVKQLLPFLDEAPKASQEDEYDNEPVDAKTQMESSEYVFEPDPAAVLEHLLPRIIESQIYQAILESDASEHSARMVMMKNATEAAGDLIADYTLTYNQLRQNKITTELAEITAGKIALE